MRFYNGGAQTRYGSGLCGALMVVDTPEEKDFRERYAAELRKKKVANSVNPNFGRNELLEEKERVKRQEQMTPGRRGEQIKYEEIDKEILRRINSAQRSQ